ncbi:MAG: BrnT family toxin [Patescibacteria group bacterium]
MANIPSPIAFEWDQGNIDKNLNRHDVRDREAEEAFHGSFDLIFEDVKHSLKETRYMILGETRENRRIAVFFTVRNDKIRIISARDMSKKERRDYEKKI